ncbi:MAG: ribose-phosphate diphosphokinase [Candidatus Pacearchaeota archaeon]
MSDEVAILADPEGKCYGFAKKVYQYIVEKPERDFPVRFVNIEIKRFRDREEKVRITENIRKKQCYFIHDSSKEPAYWFTELALINETLHSSAASEIVDVLPYLKFARQDRKDESRTSQNAKVVAELISKYADRCISVDVHAPQIQGFFGIPFDNLYSFPTIVEYLYKNHKSFLENIVVMSPDRGGVERATSFKNKLAKKGIEASLAIGYKSRPKPGEVSEKYEILGEVKGKNVLIVDDIIDSGGTLCRAADALRKKHAKAIWAYATHGLFTEGTRAVTRKLDKVLVSDTIYNKRSRKLEIISLAELFGEAIYRAIKGESISELF